jgi:hypothetical protein
MMGFARAFLFVIPGRAQRELRCAIAHLRIHFTAWQCGSMDSGLDASHRPGMTTEECASYAKIARRANQPKAVNPPLRKYSA